jgi:hypothetical protein
MGPLYIANNHRSTYGIPTISSILVNTGQLSARGNAGKVRNPFTLSRNLYLFLKRYVDTEILIAEFLANPPSSERSVKAIARMNYLHGYVFKEKET